MLHDWHQNEWLGEYQKRNCPDDGCKWHPRWAIIAMTLPMARDLVSVGIRAMTIVSKKTARGMPVYDSYHGFSPIASKRSQSLL